MTASPVVGKGKVIMFIFKNLLRLFPDLIIFDILDVLGFW